MGPPTSGIKDIDGRLLQTEGEVAPPWTEYGSELFKRNRDDGSDVEDESSGITPQHPQDDTAEHMDGVLLSEVETARPS